MYPDQENFDQLRKLLVLKRYEQPPPGYFNRFSVQVIARIRAGETGSPRFSILDFPWLERLWGVLEAKPSFAGAFGVVACGLLLTGVIYSERTDAGPKGMGIGLMPSANVIADSPMSGAEATLAKFGSTGMRLHREPYIPTASPYFQVRPEVLQRVNFFDSRPGQQ